MKKRFYTFILFLFLLAMSAPLSIGLSAEAQKEKARAEEKTVSLEEMVVTATSGSSDFQTRDVDIEQSSIFITVIPKEEFEGKITDLSEVIEKAAGIQVRQSGGAGSFSSVSLRGSASEQVMVFLDGILLNDASGGGVDLSNISLSDVAAIEIYKGATPANFGKSSIGGAINIKTLRSQKGVSGHARAGYGSFNTRNLTGYLNAKPGKWDLVLSSDYKSSDNDFTFTNDNGTQFNPLDDKEEKRNNAQFDQKDVMAKLGYDLSAMSRLDLAYQWFDKNQGLPNWRNSENVQTSLETKRQIATARLTTDNITPLHLNSALSFEFLTKEEVYDDRGGHIGLGEQHSKYTTNRYGITWYVEKLLDSQTIGLTLSGLHETFEPLDYLGRSTPHDSNRNLFSAAVEDTFFFFNNKLTLTPGLRCLAFRDELKSGVSPYGIALDEQTRNQQHVSPQLGASFQALPWMKIKSNLARHVREPSFYELFGDRGFTTGNMDLEAEEGVNFDLGVEISRDLEWPWLDRVRASAVYFRSDVDNLITRTYDARGVGKAVNISGTMIQGVESSLDLGFLKHFKLFINFTWQDTENESDIKAFNGKKLPGRFETACHTRLEARLADLKLYVEYTMENNMFYDTANLLKAADKRETNLGLTWQYGRWRINLEAKNIQDNVYEDFNGYPLPGRSCFATVKLSF